MRGPRSISWLVALAALSVAGAAASSNKYLEVVADEVALKSAAYRHANMQESELFTALDERGIPYQRVDEDVPGVRTPIRLTGKLHGVSLHSALPEKQRASSPYEILDARLALSLDDFCKLLERHGIVELVHFTMYRPEGKRSAPATRHPGGLAIDVGALRKQDGEWLQVESHWSPKPGAKTCGAGARKLTNPRGSELKSLICEAYSERLFTYMLTPHFDRAHRNHLHLEVKPGVKWFLVN